MDVDGLNDATQSDIVAAGLLFLTYFAVFGIAALAVTSYVHFEQVRVTSIGMSPSRA